MNWENDNFTWTEDTFTADAVTFTTEETIAEGKQGSAMTYLDFETKTDRELLLLVAQKSNETVDHLAKLNATIIKHEKRLVKLETIQGCGDVKSRWKANWQIMTWIACVLGLVIIEIGQKLNWWQYAI